MNDTERQVEIPWMLDRVAAYRAALNRPAQILDIGGAGAFYLDDLLRLCAGDSLTVIDPRPVSHPGLQSIEGFVQDLPPRWDACFDVVVCISVLDHVGLEAYGQKHNPQALQAVVEKMGCVLKPSGIGLVTIPYGRNYITTHPEGEQRVFDLHALQELFPTAVWDWGNLQVWRLESERYVFSSPEESANAEYAGHRAGACMALELRRR